MERLPNIITLSRIAGSLGLLFCDVAGVAFWVLYVLCGITDIADGWVARKFHAETKAGAILDSLAFSWLAVAGRLSLYCTSQNGCGFGAERLSSSNSSTKSALWWYTKSVYSLIPWLIKRQVCCCSSVFLWHYTWNPLFQSSSLLLWLHLPPYMKGISLGQKKTHN